MVDDPEKLAKAFEVINSKCRAKLLIVYTLLNTRVCHLSGFYKILKINKGTINHGLRDLVKRGIIEEVEEGEHLIEKEAFKTVMRKYKNCGDYHIKRAKFYKLRDDFLMVFESLRDYMESKISGDIIESIENFKKEIRVKHEDIEERNEKLLKLLEQELQQLSKSDVEELKKAIEDGRIHKVIDYFNERFGYSDGQLREFISENFGLSFSVFPRKVLIILDKMREDGMKIENVLRKL